MSVTALAIANFEVSTYIFFYQQINVQGHLGLNFYFSKKGHFRSKLREI